MNALAIISNILILGLGSGFVGQVGQGIAQIVVFGFGLALSVSRLGFLAIIAIPLMIGAWIRGLITAFGSQPQNMTVTANTN
ncbi:hypothetical protein NHN26_15050 [Rhodovulum tesquicola]|uniref:hypothetical protein n=1 Tax=Rhodovulum tesquicola TaxID=540254 RepID=UPI002096D55C|nr:hypothetical protein [Rhodovulum tesquicola]MCO8146537.1 hypothetical protein [Rhodovulum tesquicola]